ncbi:hypothetical protein NQZ68_040674 [Dissostichus eleginoides]|nr:hypothetical protein NQZ68_040674 [Dissostichus eleginoides]
MYSAALCGSCVEKMEGEAQAATWLVLVGMTDRPGANYIRLWRSGWLPLPPPHTPGLLRSLPACRSFKDGRGSRRGFGGATTLRALGVTRTRHGSLRINLQ